MSDLRFIWLSELETLGVETVPEDLHCLSQEAVQWSYDV